MPHESSSRLFVFTSPVDGRADEYDDWYENTHLAEVLMVPGIYAAQRFRLGMTPPEGSPAPPAQNLAVYEIKGDPDVALAAMMERAPSMKMSDSLDLASVAMWLFTEHGVRQVS